MAELHAAHEWIPIENHVLCAQAPRDGNGTQDGNERDLTVVLADPFTVPVQRHQALVLFEGGTDLLVHVAEHEYLVGGVLYHIRASDGLWTSTLPR